MLHDRVTVGHAAIIHGATVEDDALVGMRAVVMNGAVISSGSIVASGALVTEGTVIPPGSIAMGIPAKVVREATDADREYIKRAAGHYVTLAEQYASGDG